jgi:hypothetical protein
VGGQGQQRGEPTQFFFEKFHQKLLKKQKHLAANRKSDAATWGS